MLRAGAKVIEEETAEAWDARGAAAGKPATAPPERPPAPTTEQPAWREAHQRLGSIGQRRAALDADEAYWLREAERLEIWKEFGMVGMIDYLERTLGYAPRTAQQRLRVARALVDLPAITGALGRGELGFSAVRELVRVATPATEEAWLEAARDKNLRQIEELVVGLAPGDRPGDPPDPDLVLRTVRFELRPSTFALLREAQRALAEEHGCRLDDNELIAAMCSAVLEGGAARDCGDGRARYQIGLEVCPRCGTGHQVAAGVKVPVDAATVERARCDAQYIGSAKGDVLARATQTIPPRIVRGIWRRDKGRCQTPGCRSARGLEIHHIVARSQGGSHAPSNLTLRCHRCHSAHHSGKLTISGIAPDQIVTQRNVDHRMPPIGAHVGASVRADARGPANAGAHAGTERGAARHPRPPPALHPDVANRGEPA